MSVYDDLTIFSKKKIKGSSDKEGEGGKGYSLEDLYNDF